MNEIHESLKQRHRPLGFWFCGMEVMLP